jgi:hypothetical protein
MKQRWAALAAVLAFSGLMPRAAAAQSPVDSTGSARPGISPFVLGQNYPNPFSPETRIPFVVGNPTSCPAEHGKTYRVTMKIFNLLASSWRCRCSRVATRSVTARVSTTSTSPASRTRLLGRQGPHRQARGGLRRLPLQARGRRQGGGEEDGDRQVAHEAPHLGGALRTSGLATCGAAVGGAAGPTAARAPRGLRAPAPPSSMRRHTRAARSGSRASAAAIAASESSVSRRRASAARRAASSAGGRARMAPELDHRLGEERVARRRRVRARGRLRRSRGRGAGRGTFEASSLQG